MLQKKSRNMKNIEFYYLTCYLNEMSGYFESMPWTSQFAAASHVKNMYMRSETCKEHSSNIKGIQVYINQNLEEIEELLKGNLWE